MTRNQPNSEPADSIYKDPFTGTTPVGPVQTVGENRPRGRWSLAARWLIFAILVLMVLFMLNFLRRE